MYWLQIFVNLGDQNTFNYIQICYILDREEEEEKGEMSHSAAYLLNYTRQIIENYIAGGQSLKNKAAVAVMQ